jgi:hypothetical protein
VRRGAVLEQEDALPSAELQPSVGDGDAELGLGQRALDVGRHVVRPFVIVAVERDIFWHDAMQKSTEVAPHIGRCILLDQLRPREGLSAGERRIRTIGTAQETTLFGCPRSVRSALGERLKKRVSGKYAQLSRRGQRRGGGSPGPGRGISRYNSSVMKLLQCE